METLAHWLPVGSEGKQGGSSNVPRSPGDGEAASQRAAAALLLSFYGPLKESRNSDDDAVELSAARVAQCATKFRFKNWNNLEDLWLFL